MIRAHWTDVTKKPWEHKVMVKQALRARIFTISGFVMNSCCALGFVMAPLFGLSIRTINNRTDPYEDFILPLQTCYPIDYNRTVVFEFIYMTQVITAIFASSSFTIPDNLFGALVFHASGRCEILQRRTRALLEYEDVAALNYEQFRIKLREIVKMHVRLSR